jgi:heme exporter protein CcmD
VGTGTSVGEKMMNEFLNMGGYAFYVWSSIGFFIAAMIIDFASLKIKEKTVKRTIISILKRKQNQD